MNRRFAFWADPLFAMAMALLAINEVVIKPTASARFFHYYFNDLLLIPCALPILLWIHRRLGWRDNRPPSAGEIGAHLFLWCLLFEVVGPRIMTHATGDAFDILAYLAGGLGAWLVWNHPRLSTATAP